MVHHILRNSGKTKYQSLSISLPVLHLEKSPIRAHYETSVQEPSLVWTQELSVAQPRSFPGRPMYSPWCPMVWTRRGSRDCTRNFAGLAMEIIVLNDRFPGRVLLFPRAIPCAWPGKRDGISGECSMVQDSNSLVIVLAQSLTQKCQVNGYTMSTPWPLQEISPRMYWRLEELTAR
jgi:hypothetical protein